VDAAGVAVDRIIWGAAPRISTAQLYWRYGIGRLAGTSTFEQLARKEWQRFYCKIAVRTPSLLVAGNHDTVYWYGVIDLTRDIVEGRDLAVPSGRQAMIAYGLEGDLYRYAIRDAVHRPPADWSWSVRGPTQFDEKQNRTTAKTAAGYYVRREPDTSLLWSTRYRRM
jgi:hypothetical protein